MRRSTLAIATFCVSLAAVGARAQGSSPAVAAAQELQVGTWSGTILRLRAAGNQNPQPQRVSLEVKTVPDPHSSWRPGRGELLDIVFVAPGNQGRNPVADFSVDKASLSFSYRREDTVTKCRLDRQPDGSYEGQCVGEEDGRRFRITLNPPKGSA